MNGEDKRDTAGQSKMSRCRDERDTGFPLRGNPSVPASRQPSPEERLRTLSRRLGRLSPNWRDPEAFFEERSEIEAELRRVAREVQYG